MNQLVHETNEINNPQCWDNGDVFENDTRTIRMFSYENGYQVSRHGLVESSHFSLCPEDGIKNFHENEIELGVIQFIFAQLYVELDRRPWDRVRLYDVDGEFVDSNFTSWKIVNEIDIMEDIEEIIWHC